VFLVGTQSFPQASGIYHIGAKAPFFETVSHLSEPSPWLVP
jgi:hypothetical protein